MQNDWIIPWITAMVSLLLGWLLNEFSRAFRLRYEGRRRVGKVLAKLLSVWHQFKAFEETSNHLNKVFKIPEQHQIILRMALHEVLDQVLPTVEDFEKRYNKDLEELAGDRPYLAFLLHQNESILKSIKSLRSLAVNTSTDQESIQTWNHIERVIVQEAIPMLQRHIFILGGYHGWVTWLRVMRRLKKPVTSEKEMQKLLSPILQKLNESEQNKRTPEETTSLPGHE